MEEVWRNKSERPARAGIYAVKIDGEIQAAWWTRGAFGYATTLEKLCFEDENVPTVGSAWHPFSGGDPIKIDAWCEV